MHDSSKKTKTLAQHPHIIMNLLKGAVQRNRRQIRYLNPERPQWKHIRNQKRSAVEGRKAWLFM